MFRVKLLSLAIIGLITLPATATEFSVGGFIKGNARLVDGNVPFTNMWTGGGEVNDYDSQRTQFSAQESRVNAKFKDGELTGFTEIDFVGSSQGNGNISNSYSPRLRHAYLNYKDFTVGQTWSTIVNTSAFPETANLGGTLVGEHLVRQALVRYSKNNFQIALENPNTYGTDANNDPLSKENDSIPDLIVRYNLSGDWGNISTSMLVRKLSPTDNDDEITLGGSVAGKILLGSRNDLRFTLAHGKLGRYFGTGAAYDVYRGEVETSTGGSIAYRHFLTDTIRTNLFYGHTVTDIQEVNRSHYGINIFTNLTPKLTTGFEIGRYSVNDDETLHTEKKDGYSNYAQISVQYSF